MKVEQKSDDKSVKVKADKDVKETKSVKADDKQAEEYVSTILHFMQESGKPKDTSEERSALLKENCKKLKELTPPSSFVEEHKQLVNEIDILEDSFTHTTPFDLLSLLILAVSSRIQFSVFTRYQK
ncbi:hypothetical protein [Bacillus sp. BP-3]|uniref:hypothetical protein n=1 Tax=Bacillus sp. BP-3 TaxID=3022773 RepID=UPI00232FE7EA|nr:hypothetical protein [Bacillus sp. BP-3]MDC2864562.1 hypothetical protein [Bacillus sp. BP-3]